ncbi:LysR family transcriptional regulator [Prauserella marina]|uniref:DNA-binding transcriptional regulator, LysR family n=2 Tax=Prauserella marina TaxID=530584 RepID=A0A222VQ68_9PSEU|nr:LysR family transcriptional regulator [Prauserella marina]PWV84063.1 DNA-binding transcriptional LysR family regulator [Prauserella marina]SDC31280.1 DNA-binding transcriptional regulator, LysR family [Prauserella marina]
MELRHLRYFVAVAAERSMSRAAEQLHLTQPSLSRQIRQLEQELGVVLFERTTTGTALTPGGAAFYHHARLLLRLAEASREAAHSAGEATREVVDLGIPPGLSPDWVVRLLGLLRDEVGRASVLITEANSAEQLRMVREGRLDLGLVHERPLQALTGTRLFSQPFGLAVRPDHPLAARTECTLRELHGLRILAHGREQVQAAHDALIVAAHERGVTPLWRFAQFSEHARSCAEATESDAVVLTENSARRLLPQWPWLRLAEDSVDLTTWLIWQPATRTVVTRVAEVISGLAEPVTVPR